jgi:predicted nucleic acid-binding protein
MASYLLDTNLLLRASYPTSPGYGQAVAALSLLLPISERVCVTAQNLIEFWAVATRPTEANGFGWGTERVAMEIEQILAQFTFLEDSPDVVTYWRQLVTAYSVTGKRVHDARLVAVMQTHNITHLLTFNTQDFKLYTEIALVHPEDVI